MILTLESLEHTKALARALAACITGGSPRPPVLMNGQLGAGKTTFIRELVTLLPGSEEAEVSSPSFNILNIYPTSPPVGHFDLYRTSGLGFGADLEDVLFDPTHFCLLEWAEYLPEASRPDAWLHMDWAVSGEVRRITLKAHGEEAEALYACVQQHLAL